jgi:hypothetical protein
VVLEQAAAAAAKTIIIIIIIIIPYTINSTRVECKNKSGTSNDKG